MKRTALLVTVAAIGILTMACAAGSSKTPAAGVAAVNLEGEGLGAHGYDVVAYFTDGKPVKGSAEFSHEWKGATWQFASAEHRDAFAAAPEKYAPQFGGYCAYAVSRGYTANGDPETWKVVDGKLYLNYSAAAAEKWNQDVPGNIAKGNENWPQLLDGTKK